MDPISAQYRDKTMYTLPAPASGAIWLSAMGMLQHFEPAGQGTVLDSHRVTEALRVSLSLLSICTRRSHLANMQLAYGQRNELGDPAFVPKVIQKQKDWISAEATEKRAQMIDDERTFPPEYYALHNK